jgi:hypothetical protein
MELQDALYDDTIAEILQEINQKKKRAKTSVFTKSKSPPPVKVVSSPSIPRPIRPVNITTTTVAKKWAERKNPPCSLGNISNLPQATVIICNCTEEKAGEDIDKCGAVIRLSRYIKNPGVEYIGSRTDLLFISETERVRIEDMANIKAYNIWVDMQASYGQSSVLKKKFGRPEAYHRPGQKKIRIDYRSLSIVDGKYFKIHGPTPLEVTTVLWCLDNLPGEHIILYGIDTGNLLTKWSQLLQKLQSQGTLTLINL